MIKARDELVAKSKQGEALEKELKDRTGELRDLKKDLSKKVQSLIKYSNKLHSEGSSDEELSSDEDRVATVTSKKGKLSDKLYIDLDKLR